MSCFIDNQRIGALLTPQFALPLQLNTLMHPFVLRLARRLAVVPCLLLTGFSVQAQGTSTCPVLSAGQSIKVPLKNPSFDQLDAQGRMRDWAFMEHVTPGHYTFEADSKGAKSAPASARIQRVKTEDYGSMVQGVAVDPCWKGKTARLTGFLRTQEANGVGAALTLQVRLADGGIGLWDHMNDRRVRGTQGWNTYSVDVKVGDNAYSLLYGLLLEGEGTLWADDLQLEILP